MDLLRAKFGVKKKKGNLLSDPNEQRGGGAAQESRRGTTATTQRKQTQQDLCDPGAYSVVGGDGAIGGLEWTEEETIEEEDPYHNRRASDDVQVPTIGQIDQLTDEQQALIAAAQSQAIGVPSVEVLDDWAPEDHQYTRTRSGADVSLPRSGSTLGVGGLGFTTALSANSAAAMVAGSRSAYGGPVVGSPTAVVANGLGGEAHRSSNPSSRRGSTADSHPSTPVLQASGGSLPYASTVALLHASPSSSPLAPTEPSSSPIPPATAPTRSVSASTIVAPQRPALSYPKFTPTSRLSSVAGPHSSMMSIGRAVVDEVKALVQTERLTSSDGTGAPHARVSSPAYSAYVTAIQDAKKKSATLPPPVAAPARAAHSPLPPLPPAVLPLVVTDTSLAHGPPLPPRTHIRQRYSITRYGSRRGSVVSPPSRPTPSARPEQLTLEQLIPLNPLAHLVGTTYLLLYLALHKFMPATLALLLPLLAYFALVRAAVPIEAFLARRFPEVHAELISPRAASPVTVPVPVPVPVLAAAPVPAVAPTPVPAPVSPVSPLLAVVDDAIMFEAEEYMDQRGRGTTTRRGGTGHDALPTPSGIAQGLALQAR